MLSHILVSVLFFLQNILAIKNQTFHTVDAVSYNLHYAFNRMNIFKCKEKNDEIDSNKHEELKCDQSFYVVEIKC